jgi:hypothetical protein
VSIAGTKMHEASIDILQIRRSGSDLKSTSVQKVEINYVGTNVDFDQKIFYILKAQYMSLK